MILPLLIDFLMSLIVYALVLIWESTLPPHRHILLQITIQPYYTPITSCLIFKKELSLGRYSGPFSRSRLELLLGPFRSSPLGTILKSHDSTDHRIVQDLSFPRNEPARSSVNDQININDFRCDWGTFNNVWAIVVDTPEGTEAATLNVDSAFRCCPILPSQQHNFIVHWNGLYYIDHNAPFRATSTGGVFGRVADAKSAILKSKKIGPSKNWVNNFVFFRFPLLLSPEPVFPYSLSDIYALAKCLSWPWKESKTRPFVSEFKYLGFVWNLSAKTVQIPDQKKICYLEKLDLAERLEIHQEGHRVRLGNSCTLLAGGA